MTTPQRDLNEMLDLAVSELASAVRRSRRGSRSAYISAAVHLRTLIGTGKGNDLLNRAVRGATLAPLPPLPPTVTEALKDPAVSISFHPGTTLFSGADGLSIELEWDRKATPVSVAAWRRQVLLVAHERVTLGTFVQQMGNQEGGHADTAVGRVLAAVARSGFISVNRRRLSPGPAYVIAIADYVRHRAQQLRQADG